MALFGRESDADAQRAQRVRDWVQRRSPFALVSGMLGVMAMLDSFTGVLGVALGAAAIVLAVRGLRDLKQRPHLVGRRLCCTGLALGSVGVLVGVAIWTFL